MRPVSLELEGFGAFRDRTVVDLADADVFAIVGATGHGKSTLIDAICFALYGKVPRHGERDIAPVMTLGCNETKVSFAFELGGSTYVATRVLRRKARGQGAETRAARLERQLADDAVDVLATTKTEFDDAVARLVGLRFDQFTKCVVLPQGDFAAFLHASPADRVTILTALLDVGRFERMAVAARERAKLASGRRDALVAERERLADVTRERYAAAAERRDALAGLVGAIEDARPRDAALADDTAAAERDAEAAGATVAALELVHVPDEVRDLEREMEAARVAAADAEAAATAAEAHAAGCDAECEQEPSLEVLVAAADAHARLADLAARLAAGAPVLEERRAAEAAAQDALVAARTVLDDAQTALEVAHRKGAHAELRATLRVGEPCPVCEQDVATLPPRLRSSELTKAKKTLDSARARHDDAARDARRAVEALAKAEVLADTLADQERELHTRVDALPDPAEVHTLLDARRAQQERAAKARAAATRARRDAQEATRAFARFDAARLRADAEMQAQRDAVVAAGLVPPSGDWDALARWADDLRPEHEKRAAELDDLARQRRAERDALTADLLARACELSVAEPEDVTIASLGIAAVAAHRDAVAHATRIDEQLARAHELDREITQVRAAESVATALGQLLDRRHFGQWLVDEALGALVAGASTLLEELSAGQYALTTATNGDLLVVDHGNADETRSVRSLSGGETFQASLALALALAERVGELAPGGTAALESVFLDEGFGTLDPETLDIVAGTIESLGHRERVVGVVTHDSELAERMPVRFRVRKTGRTSVVTREES